MPRYNFLPPSSFSDRSFSGQSACLENAMWSYLPLLAFSASLFSVRFDVVFVIIAVCSSLTCVADAFTNYAGYLFGVACAGMLESRGIAVKKVLTAFSNFWPIRRQSRLFHNCSGRSWQAQTSPPRIVRLISRNLRLDAGRCKIWCVFCLVFFSGLVLHGVLFCLFSFSCRCVA